MISPADEYAGKVVAPTTEYPYGKAQNITSPGDGTGTPWEAKLVNDLFGLQQFLANKAGIVPSGTPDNATNSQQFDALWKLLNYRTLTFNLNADTDLTLSTDQNLYKFITITDTGVVLTTGRNVIVDTVGRLFIVANSTAQTLTVKTAAGTGVDIPAGGSSLLINNGTNVTLLTTADPVGDYDLANKKYVDDNSGLAGGLSTQNLLHIQDQKTSGTNGGSSIVGTQTRDLNTVIINNITGASLSSNQITLSSGGYYIEASAVTYTSQYTRLKLYNVTDGADELNNSLNNRAITNDHAQTALNGYFTIADTKVFELRQYTSVAQATNGLGSAVNDGLPEIYSEIKIWKVG
jgi:hypothetical protein